MTKQRYNQLQWSENAILTDEEMAEGWYFCICEWDGLLIKEGDPESQVCSCKND